MLAIGRLLCQPRPGCGLLRSLRSGPVLDLPLTGMRERFPHIVYQKEVKVPSFGGSLWVNSEIPVKVAPTGPPEHPTMDRAFVRLRGVEAGPKVDPLDRKPQETKLLKIEQQGHKLQVLEGEEKAESGKTVAEIKIPMVHSINVSTTSQGHVDAEDFIESSYCILQTDAGDVSVSRIKSEQITLETDSGDVFCNGSLQGKISITTGSGNVVADRRFAGPSLDINTDSGDIRVAASYAETAKFSTNTGSMNLRNLHNESYIAVYESGDCKAHGIDGQCNIFVKKGDVDVHIAQLIHVEEGDVILRMSDVAPVKISIDANDIIPDIKFANHGKVETNEKHGGQKHYFAAIHPNSFSPSVTVLAENGNVMLESQDWAASLGLKIPAGSPMSPHKAESNGEDDGAWK